MTFIWRLNVYIGVRSDKAENEARQTVFLTVTLFLVVPIVFQSLSHV